MNLRHSRVLKGLVLLLFFTIVLAAGCGAYPIAPWDIPFVLWSKMEGYPILLYIRFPRICLAAIVGAALAMSGASLQGLFRNPLADPGLLGINAGAGLGAAIWIVLIGNAGLGIWSLPIAASIGAWLVTILVWQLGQIEGRVSISSLLLAGIALNSFAGAGIGLLTYIADDQQMRSLSFWLMGGLGGASWQLFLVACLFGGIGIFAQLVYAQSLNLLSLGASDAYHMGVDTDKVKNRLILGSTICVAASVATSGGIGFIALVVPHLLRMRFGADHPFLLPASALGGAILLILADLIARVSIAPAELPVGIVTALFGAPFLSWLLFKTKKDILYMS